SLGGESTIAKFDEFDITYKAMDAAQNAFDCGKRGGIFGRINKCFKIKNGEVDIGLKTEVSDESISDFVAVYYQSIGCSVVENTYMIENDKLYLHNGKPGKGIDKQKMTEDIKKVLLTGKSGKIDVKLTTINPMPWDVDKVYNEMCTEPINASYEERGGKGYIIEAKNGYLFDKNDLKKLIDKNKDNPKAYTLNLQVVEPKVKHADESGLFKEVLSRYNSSTAGSDENRLINLKIACASINGTVLNPDAVFSYNKAVGQITEAAGYREATIFTTKGHEMGIGGGICQVSSALYSAVLYGNLETVKRKNHMYIVGYVPYGQDATVYEGELDFRFKNNTNKPIKIAAELSGGYVRVTIYGEKPDPSVTVEIENITVSRTPPETIVKEDNTLARGKVKVQEKGTVGLTVDTYKKTFRNGVLESRQYLHRSIYQPIQRIEIRGTKPTVATSTEPQDTTTNSTSQQPQQEPPQEPKQPAPTDAYAGL
ncbi:MAG: VanW family protein, partial [Bacillota bacterium]|nr:VanW family protein [Bacillota bacterium]